MHDLIHSWGNNLFSFQFVADFLCNAQSLGAADAPHQMQMTSISAWRKHESASPFFLTSKTPVSNPTSAKLQTGTVVWQTNPSIKRAFREHHPDAISSLCNNGSRISSCWRGGEKKGAKKTAACASLSSRSGAHCSQLFRKLWLIKCAKKEILHPETQLRSLLFRALFLSRCNKQKLLEKKKNNRSEEQE